ncbi:hypothetical protein K402DRAFT_325430 [Aulographum hederae CBS 113979]|uniref:Cytochrome b-c1 complex subunit 8 n=1 Tax=Aulographum hederae CBS 113979 TaxID=1176131 RepID=A0A6G1H9Y6_9PEZI|nr:hypothetical protein K402DRAFT_325430 [Aulographum hederae CBS 113979]
MAGGGDKAPGQYLGGWGNFGSPPQKGITTYSLSPNRQRPLAGAWHNAIFNTYRRVKGQIFYIVPPFAVAYFAMSWAEERNRYLNSKAGRAEFAAEEEE